MKNELILTLCDMYEYKNHLISADIPRELCLGWACTKNDKQWKIPLFNLRKSFCDLLSYFDEKDHEEIKSYFITSEGKNNINIMLEKFPIFKKINKLKAFL